MNMKTLIMFGFFALVVIATVVMVYRNRKTVQASRNRAREMSFREPVLTTPENPEYQNANCILDTQIDDAATISHTEIVSEQQSEEESYPKQPVNNPLFPNDLIVLMLRARLEQPYTGYELLQALLSAGLRFGKMNIFHRYEQLNSSDQVLFSLASAVEPGTFEIPKMGGFSCPGLMLFMRVSTQKDLSNSFEIFLDTAKQLIDDLGGEIWDDQRQQLSEEKIAAWRSKINIYEQSRQTEDMFALT